MSETPEDNLEVGKRVRHLWKTQGYRTASAFATRLGISIQRLSNVQQGQPLGKELAFRIVQVVPGLTTDWLWYGETSGPPVQLARSLDIPPDLPPGKTIKRS